MRPDLTPAEAAGELRTEYVMGYADTETPIPGREPTRNREAVEADIRARKTIPESHVLGDAVVLERRVTDWKAIG
jgi:hypothetical protein